MSEEEDLSAFQIKERKQRMIFVGNLPKDSSEKDLIKIFKPFGNIQKVWFRSIALELSAPQTQKAKIATKMYGEQKETKNAYVLFGDRSSAEKAASTMNQTEFNNKHIRVDLEIKNIKVSGQDDKINDYQSSIFIGNLPWVVDEEALREHFKDCGDIQNVRIIRDSHTLIGKGFGYVMFGNKEQMNKAIQEKNGSTFKGRELRVKRAVEAKRLEKKQINKTKKRDQKFENKKDEKRSNFLRRMQQKEAKQVGSKVDKETAKFLESASKNLDGNNEQIEIKNNISVNKKTKQKVLQELMDDETKKGESRTQHFKNRVFKDQPKFNEILKKKREHKRKINLKKFHSIRIKKKQ